MRLITVPFVLILVFLVAISSLTASETRVFSMGQVGNFIHDNSNISMFPSTMLRYNNQLVTELRVKDNETFYSAEARLPLTDEIMLGVNFNRPITIFNPGIGNNITLNQTSDIYLGTKLALGDAGVRISLARDAFENDAVPKLEESARYLELAGGLSTDLYDVSASITLPSITSKIGDSKDEWGGLGLNMNGRYFHEASKRITYVPVFMLGFSSTSEDFVAGAGQPKVETGYGSLSFSLGAGLHYKIDSTNTLVLAIDPFRYSKTSADTKGAGELSTTSTTLPRLYLGLETRIASWLVGRIGANRAYVTQTITTDPDQGTKTETKQQFSPYNVTFGLGFSMGKLLIDIDINDGFLFEGPNFISGRTRDMVNRVSVSYAFDKE